MTIYTISGLGADHRVFDYLDIDVRTVHLDWIPPLRNESISDYAGRLSERINTDEPYGILGVSFGGLIAVEISKQSNPTLTILISSVETKDELPNWIAFLGSTGLIPILPSFVFRPPKWIAKWWFGAQNTSLLSDILRDTDPRFARWAAHQLSTWNNTTQVNNPILKIIGESDRLLPLKKGDKNTIIVKGGHHFMIVDKAEEVSYLIKRVIIKMNLQ